MTFIGLCCKGYSWEPVALIPDYDSPDLGQVWGHCTNDNCDVGCVCGSDMCAWHGVQDFPVNEIYAFLEGWPIARWQLEMSEE